MTTEIAIPGRESVMRRAFLILALVLTMVPAPAFADAITILVGPQTVSFGGDLAEYYDISPGLGGEFLVGLRLPFPIDFRIGRRNATEGNSGSDVTYDWIEVGTRFRLGREGVYTSGDWFVGVGSYDLTIGGLEFETAPGGFIGMGVEQTVSDGFVGRLEVKGVYWQSDTFTTDAPSLNLSLLFGVTF